VEESELVPSSLAPIVPILRAANEIEEENPRVAYLCTCSNAAGLEFEFVGCCDACWLLRLVALARARVIFI
jgi:hypothetical protein